MSRRNRGINERYRGRGRGRGGLRALLVVLAALLGCAIAFLLMLGRYIEYTDDGVRLNLPWFQREQPAPSAPVPGVSGGELIVTQEPDPTPTPDPLPAPVQAVEADTDAMTDGTAADAVRAAGGNALLVTVKDAEGHLAWASQNELARSAGLTGSGEFDDAVRALDDEGELYLIARLTSVQDLWMCVHSRELALTTPGGKLWYDTNGMPWLSAASAGARDYLTALCLELGELGFDEIVLADAGFPGRGRLTAIAGGDRYPDDLTEAAGRWLDEVRAALEEQGVALSVEAGQRDLEGSRATGLTAEALAGVHRVWLEAGADARACAEALTLAGMEDVDHRLALLKPEAGWEGSAVLPGK